MLRWALKTPFDVSHVPVAYLYVRVYVVKLKKTDILIRCFYGSIKQEVFI